MDREQEQEEEEVEEEGGGGTHVAELLVDLAGLCVHLHVGEAGPLVQVLAVVDLADAGLGFAGRQDLQHVGRDVVLGLGLLVVLPVETLDRRTTPALFSSLAQRFGHVGGATARQLHSRPGSASQLARSERWRGRPQGTWADCRGT